MSEIHDLKNISTDQIRQLQMKSLEILLYFKDFCEKHNLLFYLCGGCCIGTIRNNGFIPWDDDIDVFMPREDYERLTKLWHENANIQKYSLCRTNRDVNYHDNGMSIRDNETTFINKHSQDSDINHGLALEIMPLDGCPSSKVKRMAQMFFAAIYSLFNAQRLPDNQGKFFRYMAKVVLFIVRSPNLRYKIWSYSQRKMTKHKIENCEYVTELVTGFRYMKNKYPKYVFDRASYKEFEGYQMPIPDGYDTYLRMAFGNYMELPPEEERKPKHDAVYINLDKSYKEFKGIYYCVD